MTPLAQAIAAYASVAAASVWLLWRWLSGRRAAACDRCGPGGARPLQRGIRPASLRVLR
jgi:hypothetical protein